MTIEKPKPGAPDADGETNAVPSRKSPGDAGKTKEGESEEEKIKREQATKPALMPIGDPAGAA